MVYGRPLEPVKLIDGRDLGLGRKLGRVIVAEGDLLVLPQASPLDAAHGDTAHIVIIVDGGNQHLKRPLRIAGRRVNMGNDGFKQGSQVGSCLTGREAGRSFPGRTEHHRAVQLFVGGVQLQKKLQNFVHHVVRARIRAVYLVDDDDDLVVEFQCLLQDKPRLGHGPFKGVHQQQNAIDHFQGTLHLAAKIGMPGGIHNVDLNAIEFCRRILGQNGDAALPLDISGIHDPFVYNLVVPEDAALFEHLVYQRRLAMVNMGDNGDVAQIISNCFQTFSFFQIKTFVFSSARGGICPKTLIYSTPPNRD